MIEWQEIETVLLDMDGTILDLHYDNYFWLEHLPKRYSEINKIDLIEAKKILTTFYENVAGTIHWYCLDYWIEKTQLPITQLKREVEHLIQLREDAKQFLIKLKESNREVILVTNAHPESLSLKIEKTQLDQYFDKLYSTHQFGVTKESQVLWQKLQNHHPFTLSKTLFADDNLTILQSAKDYGFKHLLAVANPDSKKLHNKITQFNSTTDFREFLPYL